MKNILINLYALAFVFIIASCSIDEGDRSSITNVVPFNVTTITPASSTVEEDSGTHSVTVSIDENLKIDGSLSISVGEGTTATEGVDFVLNDTEITLHPWQTDYTFSYDIIDDYFLEGNEVINFELTTGSEPFFENSGKMVTSVTINDRLTDDLFLVFDWDVPFEFDGLTYTTCPFVDMDVYVLDADGNDLGIYDAATGACPEQIVVTSEWEDGTYFLASNMWDNGTLNGLIAGLDYTITMSAYRQGKIDASYVPTDVWTSDDADQTNDGNAEFREVAILTIAGNTYTVSAPDGTILGSGFKAPHKTANSL